MYDQRGLPAPMLLLLISISAYAQAADSNALPSVVAERLPLLATYMTNSALIGIATERMHDPEVPSNRERLKECDWLEGLLKQQSQTPEPLFPCLAESHYCNPWLASWWRWTVRQVRIDEDEEEIRRRIKLVLIPQEIGFLAQDPDSRIFWNAIHKLENDTELELERFKDAARTIQKEQKQQ